MHIIFGTIFNDIGARWIPIKKYSPELELFSVPDMGKIFGAKQTRPTAICVPYYAASMVTRVSGEVVSTKETRNPVRNRQWVPFTNGVTMITLESKPGALGMRKAWCLARHGTNFAMYLAGVDWGDTLYAKDASDSIKLIVEVSSRWSKLGGINSL